MGRKRSYDSGDEAPEMGELGPIPRVRSRRERAVKKPKVDDDTLDDRHSSQDSECGEHYSPTSIGEAQR